MERELRIAQIAESDGAVDQTAKDVLYGAGKWAKDGLSAILFALLLGLGIFTFICFMIAASFSAFQAVKAPIISVAIVCFVIWFFLLRAVKKMKGRFEKKME